MHGQRISRRAFVGRGAAVVAVAAAAHALPSQLGWGLGATEARAASAILDEARYVFDSARLNLPDPAVWTASGTLTPTPIAPAGLAISDPDNTSFLLYTHRPSQVSSDPTSPRFASEGLMRARLRIPHLANGSPAWSNDLIGVTMIVDWYDRQARLTLAREASTWSRQLRFTGTAPPIDFPWDNNFENTYEVVRLASGDWRLTVTNGDGLSPQVVATIPAGNLLAGAREFGFAWGSYPEGGGSAAWREVHAEVRGGCLAVASAILPPINADGSSSFKLGQTIPVRVRIADCNGLPLDTLAPRIALARVGSASGAVNEAVSSSAADTGTTMRPTGDGTYLFNLSAKRSQFNSGRDLTEGRYRLTISEPSLAAPVVAEFDLHP